MSARLRFSAPLAAALCAALFAPAAAQPSGDDQSAKDAKAGAMKIESAPFGEVEGRKVQRFTCVNANGLRLTLTDYGATVIAVETPDRDGKLANINLGFDTLAPWLGSHPYFGATVGRYANRIAAAQFTLDGKTYKLAANNGPNHLHGGVQGFHRAVWDAEMIRDANRVGVRFSRLSPDGEEGYPGNLQVTALYALTNDNELRIEFTATTDKATPVNLANHNYWNLSGAFSGSILDHVLRLHADKYLPVDETLIPTGELASVKGTPLDFTKPKRIGEHIRQIKSEPVGYDHCFVINGKPGELRPAARVADPKSGRVMEILTTQPGVQLYTGNFLSGKESEGGAGQHEAFCLETQRFPDSPNQPDFPSAILRPGETCREITVHRFSTE